MHDVIDLQRYPLDQLDSVDCQALVQRCRDDLERDGMFNLAGLMRPEAIEKAVSEVKLLFESNAFTHSRQHNIYFLPEIQDLPADHPALQKFETINHTICADQIPDSVLLRLYEWPPFAAFLAAVMGKPALYGMDDPLARLNVMGYDQGEALNWHFDRSEFTTTILLQAPLEGGQFEYDKDLRSDDDPNYDGVADLLAGRRSPIRMPLNPGTLNVFKGKNTAHRVTPVSGSKDRIVAVFSYFERPGVLFSEQERVGFYGRAS
jgi:hypothetical protein